jgi:hypothetical protein
VLYKCCKGPRGSDGIQEVEHNGAAVDLACKDHLWPRVCVHLFVSFSFSLCACIVVYVKT